MNTQSKILCWAILLGGIGLTLISLIMTLPMTQENPEKLFLRDKQLRDFEVYSKKIEERELVVGMLKVKGTLIQNLQVSDEFSTKLEEAFVDQPVSIYSFRSLYGKMYRSISEQNLRAKKVATIVSQVALLPLLGEEYVANLFIFPSHLSLREKFSILDNIKAVYGKAPAPHFLSGIALIGQGLNVESEQIKNRLFPLMFTLCFFLLWAMTGKLVPTIAIFIPSLMASGISLLTIYLCFNTMNLIDSILPLFNFAINASLGLHLLFSFSYYHSRSQNFVTMLKAKAAPISLMIGTTFVGLASCVVSDLAIIRQFALLAGSLVIITSIAHLLFAWAFYNLFPHTAALARPLSFFNRWKDLLPPTRLTFWGLTLLTLLGALCIPFIRLETEAAHYFNPKHHPIGQGIREINSTILGSPNMDIILEKNTGPWAISDMETILHLENKLLASLGPHYKILSPNQFLLEANLIAGVGKVLPDSLISYPIILGQLLGETQDTYYKNNLYRLTLMGPTLTAAEFEVFDKSVAATLQTQGPWKEITYQLTGTNYNLKSSQRNLLSVLAVSFLCSLIVITFSAYLFNRKIFQTVVFFAVNLFPLLAACLFMKLFNLSFNIATVMNFSIALGLVVDGTFHLQHAHAHLPPEQVWPAVKYPVWASGIVLSFTFGILAINSFLPIREFALALMMSIFMGMLFDLYFLDAAMKLFASKQRVKG